MMVTAKEPKPMNQILADMAAPEHYAVALPRPRLRSWN